MAGQGIAPNEGAAALVADMRSGGQGIAQTQKTIEAVGVGEAISESRKRDESRKCGAGSRTHLSPVCVRSCCAHRRCGGRHLVNDGLQWSVGEMGTYVTLVVVAPKEPTTASIFNAISLSSTEPSTAVKATHQISQTWSLETALLPVFEVVSSTLR